jgi:hypothetical protein
MARQYGPIWEDLASREHQRNLTTFKGDKQMNAKERLLAYIEENPDLVFQNDGYQEMPNATKERLARQIKEIESFLNTIVWGFVRFQNFKRLDNGDLVLRCQVHYSDVRSFVGVSYINLNEFEGF